MPPAPGSAVPAGAPAVLRLLESAERVRPAATGPPVSLVADEPVSPAVPRAPGPVGCADLLPIVHKERTELTHSLILVRIS